MADKFFYKQTTMPELISGEVKSPPLPSKIGPYKIESLLSKGGMNLLYLGVHPETKQTLVIKVLSPKYVTHQETVERFLKEAEIIALTNHPNIVKLYGQGEWEDGLYIAMEFIRGISLRQFIMQQSLSLKRSLDIVLQVAYALCHLHTHGVIHRDLKPENILITEDGEIKVIDFGIAQVHEDVDPKKTSGSKQVMGTPNYMSPEQKEDPQKVSYASDIYSLGIIAYELILGKLSYGIINSALLPKGLKKIIEKTLAVSVKERYQDIVDFITDITQYLKSGEWEKDRPGNDQVKELLELLQKAAQALSPATLPDWAPFEMGIAKYKGPAQLNLYYDFFKLPNNAYLILLAEATSPSIEAIVSLGLLHGMVRMFMREKLAAAKEPFRPLQLINALNQNLAEENLGHSFALSLVALDPLRDRLTFISCGLGSLSHLPQGGEAPRKLTSQNLTLGADPRREFVETTDNWYIGDTLFLHSLETPAHLGLHTEDELDTQLSQAIAENRLLSAQRQAEAILKRVSIVPAFTLQKYPRIIFTVQRIA